MPLKPGKSESTVSKNIEEIHTGPQYKKTEEKHGKAVADKQAIAIAESKKRESMRVVRYGGSTVRIRRLD